MSLVIETVSKSDAARRDLEAVNKSVNAIEASVKSATSGFQKMAVGIASAVAAFGTANQLASFSDAFTDLENRIRSVTDSQEDFNRALDGVKDIAIKSRSGLREVSSLYSRIAINAKELGINQKDMLKVTSSVSKAMKLAGATTAEANSAMLQFGQAIGAGALQGDELRSLLENAPVLASALAKEFKTSVGNLKEMGENGQLLSGKVLKAILNQANQIDDKFGKMKVTFGSAFSNLGTSLGLLGDSISKSILGSGGFGIADTINDLAIGIKKVSDNFKFYLLKIKTSILFFVVDASILFESLLPVFDAIGEAAVDTFKYLVTNWEPLLNKGFDTVVSWVVRISSSISGLFDNISAKGLGIALIEAAESAYDSVRAYLSNIFSNIDISSFAIDIRPFFKGFEPALDFIQYWVTKVERAFFWLYDQVIGHSWIPDLVIETGEWLKKLFGKPLEYIKGFAGKSSDIFSKIAIAAPFTAAASAVKLFGGNLATISLLATTTVGTLSYLGAKGFFGDTLAEKIKKTFSGILDQYRSFQDKFSKELSKTTLVHTIKQIFGKHDSTAGEVFGTPIDTRDSAYVGRGPQRRQEVRPLGHDIINALPKDWQIPVLAGVTGVFGLAIVKAFDSGPVRSILLSALTTAFGLAVVQNVDDSTIKKTTSALGYGFLDIVGRGIDAVLGKNALMDPLGTLSLLAKTSLLFEDGRKAILSATKALVTAPTALGKTISDYELRRSIAKDAAKAETKLAELPTKLAEQVKRANDSYNTSLTRLANLKDNTGQTIGALRASVMVQQKQLDASAKGIQNLGALQIAIAASNKAAAASTNLANIGDKTKELQTQAKEARAAEEALSTRLKEAREAVKESFRNISAGIGGTLGGVGGYQIGSAIAREMGDSYSSWQKIGVTIATSIAGQGIGSLIGATISNAILWTSGKAAALLAAAFTAAPFLAGAVAIGVALYAGYALFEGLPEKWKAALWDFNLFGTKDSATAIGLKTPEKAAEEGLTVTTVEQLGKDIKEAWKLENLAKAIRDGLLKDPLGVGELVNTTSAFLRDFWSKSTDQTMPVRKASGGYITGPGSSTSDSIPAMLSNGEFVVNARAAGKNRRLLDAINSGKGTSFFSSGGSTSEARWSTLSGTPYSPANPLSVKDVKVESKLDSVITKLKESAIGKDGKFDFNGFIEALKGVAKDTVKAVEGPKPKTEDYVPKDTRSQFRRALEGKDPASAIAKAIAEQGVGGLDVKAVAALSADTKNIIAESLDNISQSKERSAKTSSPFLKEQLSANIAEQVGVINDALRRAALVGEAPSTFTESSKGTTKGKAPKDVLFGDQLKIINETFPELGMSLDEFIDQTTEGREKLFKSALDIANKSDAINNTIIGVRDKKDKTVGDTKVLKDANEDLRANEAARKKAQAEAIATQESSRSLWRNVEKIFQEVSVGLSKSQVNELLKEDADLLFALAKELKDLNLAQDSLKDDPVKRLQLAEQIKGKTETLQQVVSDSMLRAAKGFDVMQQSGSKVGVQVERSVYNRLSAYDADILQGYLTTIANEEAKAKTASSPEIRAASQASADKARKAATAIIEKAAAKTSKYDSISAEAAKAGVNIEKSLFNRLSDAEQSWVQNTAELISQKQSDLDSDKLDEAGRQKAQAEVDSLVNGLITGLDKKRKDTVKEAGEAFASQFRSDFAGAMTGAMRGEAAENRTVLQTMYDKIMDATTNSVLNSFSKGVTDKLFGAGSNFSAILEKIGGGVGDVLPGKLFPKKKDKDGKETGETDFMGGLQGVFTGAWDSLKGIFGTFSENFKGVFSESTIDFSKLFEGFSGSFGDIFTKFLGGGSKGGGGGGAGSLLGMLGSATGNPYLALAGMVFAADGGAINGPGTSRSDSIPAMLSNGEFVVNAKATKKFAPLLHSINSNSFARFADGGLVNAQIASIDKAPAVTSSKTSTSTSAVFNLNITGDVSMQTRNEIQKMIPQIAYGVNSHNYESGRRR